MAERPAAALVVRNPASHDARVLRCARTLDELGYEPLVVAVTSEREHERRVTAQGVPIVRLSPAAPFAGAAVAARRALRRRVRGGREGEPGAKPAQRGGSGPLARAYRLLRTLSYYRQGIAAMRRLRPAVVHCNDYNTMWIGVAAKLLTGSVLIYDSHELWPDRNGRTEPRPWLLACEALFLRLADARLATSPGHAAAIGRRHRIEPPLVIRNVAERTATNGGHPLSHATDERTLVYAGAVTTGRGLEQAIDALGAAPDVELRIVGPGHDGYREQLRLLAERRQVAGRVRFEDPVPPERLVAEIASAAAGIALIQPVCRSYALSLPNKLFEYIAAGLPILAAAVPTIEDFVEREGVGRVVSPEDTGAIAAGMLEIVAADRNRALREAVAGAAERLTWERESGRLADAYREAGATGGRP